MCFFVCLRGSISEWSVVPVFKQLWALGLEGFVWAVFRGHGGRDDSRHEVFGEAVRKAD